MNRFSKVSSRLALHLSAQKQPPYLRSFHNLIYNEPITIDDSGDEAEKLPLSALELTSLVRKVSQASSCQVLMSLPKAMYRTQVDTIQLRALRDWEKMFPVRNNEETNQNGIEANPGYSGIYLPGLDDSVVGISDTSLADIFAETLPNIGKTKGILSTRSSEEHLFDESLPMGEESRIAHSSVRNRPVEPGLEISTGEKNGHETANEAMDFERLANDDALYRKWVEKPKRRAVAEEAETKKNCDETANEAMDFERWRNDDELYREWEEKQKWAVVEEDETNRPGFNDFYDGARQKKSGSGPSTSAEFLSQKNVEESQRSTGSSQTTPPPPICTEELAEPETMQDEAVDDDVAGGSGLTGIVKQENRNALAEMDQFEGPKFCTPCRVIASNQLEHVLQMHNAELTGAAFSCVNKACRDEFLSFSKLIEHAMKTKHGKVQKKKQDNAGKNSEVDVKANFHEENFKKIMEVARRIFA